MNKLMFWVKGYVKASVPKENSERLINILPRHNIPVYKLYVKNGRCYFEINKNKYMLLRPLARKTSCYPKIHKKCGGYYIAKNMLMHTGLYLGILCFGVLLYILSLFLWQIEFSGNSVHTDEQLIRYINGQGIGFGSRVNRIDCAELEAAIRETYNDISWVSVEIQGSRMIIRLREAGLNEKRNLQSNDKAHIIASKDGTITDIVTRTGTAHVKAGDIVKKGDILIAGVVRTVNEYDEIIQSIPVAADGDISISSEIIYSDCIPLEYKIKEETGEQIHGFTLRIFNKKIFSYCPSIPYERYDIITSTVNMKISNNLYLPISYDTTSCSEYVEYDACRSQSQLSEICYRRYLSNMEYYLKSGYKIIEEDVQLQVIDDSCILQGSVTLEGPFWERALLSSDELEGVISE